MSASPNEYIDNTDEDLDDLDDVLDQFTPAAKKPPQAPPPSASATSLSQKPVPDVDPNAIGEIPDEENLTTELTENFARELAKGMESLMHEIGSAEFTGGDDGEKTEEQKEKEREFRAAWEAMLIEGMGSQQFDGSQPGDLVSGERLGDSGVAGPSKDNAFQNSIQQTMEKLKMSESNLQTNTSSTKPLDPDDIESLEALFAKFGGGESLGGPESEEELQGLLETMMGQLMSKEVLYEPLKELHDKFPTYLKENASTLSPADKKRYESQLDCVSKILKSFEDPKYSDEDTDSAVKMVGLMSEMQSFGSPPPEIMGPMPPGLALGADGMPQIPEGCNIA